VGLSGLSSAPHGNSGRDQKQVDCEWLVLHGSRLTVIVNARYHIRMQGDAERIRYYRDGRMNNPTRLVDEEIPLGN